MDCIAKELWMEISEKIKTLKKYKGYLRLDNDVIKALITTDFTYTQFKAVLYVLELSYGTDKNEYKIFCRIEKKNWWSGAGLQKQNRDHVIQSLVSANVLVQRNKLDYAFNKYSDCWTIPLVDNDAEKMMSQGMSYNLHMPQDEIDEGNIWAKEALEELRARIESKDLPDRSKRKNNNVSKKLTEVKNIDQNRSKLLTSDTSKTKIITESESCLKQRLKQHVINSENTQQNIEYPASSDLSGNKKENINNNVCPPEKSNNCADADLNIETQGQMSLLNYIKEGLESDSKKNKANKTKKLTEEDIDDQDILDFFAYLKTVKAYPFNVEEDLAMYKRLKDKYCDVKFTYEIEQWANYKLEIPLKKGEAPRSQINTWFRKTQERIDEKKKWAKNNSFKNFDNKPKQQEKPEQYYKSRDLRIL